jgi:hypothetical protein
MHNDLENTELRSEEVQEILGTPPGWLVRWGTVAALIGVVALGWAGFWIELPETVESDIKITSIDPPRKFYAPNTTVLAEVFYPNEARVDSGAVILHFGSKAKLGHVLSLENDLLKIQADAQILDFIPVRDLLLGEIQEHYYDFLEKLDQYQLVASRKLDGYGRREIEKNIRELEFDIEDLQRRKNRVLSNLEDAQLRYDKELQMLKKGFLTREELNPTRSEKEKLERDVQDIESGLRNKNFQISSLKDKSRSNSGRARALQNTDISYNLLKDSFAKLKTKVAEWRREYTMESPISGTVLFVADNLAKGQFVQRDSLLLVILPQRPSGMVGRMELNAEEAGQVLSGQKVQVKLFDYPFPEYGAVWGVVDAKGRIPSGGRIPVDIRFSGDTLVTTKLGRIHPEAELRGKATIIISQKRLIQRLFGFIPLSYPWD